MEMNLALVFLSYTFNSKYNFYCKTPSMKLEIAAKNVANEVFLIVDQKFMSGCSSQYIFVCVSENSMYGVHDPMS